MPYYSIKSSYKRLRFVDNSPTLEEIWNWFEGIRIQKIVETFYDWIGNTFLKLEAGQFSDITILELVAVIAVTCLSFWFLKKIIFRR